MKLNSGFAVVLAAAFAFAACSSSNISAGQNAATGGSGSGGTHAKDSGSGGAHAKDSGLGACTCTDDSASISVASGTGPVIDCASVQADGDPLRPTSGTFEGSVTHVTASSFTVDTCGSNANCPDLRTVKVSAPGFTVTVPKGALVRVKYSFLSDFGYACTQSIEVDSLPSWDGGVNPTGMGALMLLAVVDGLFNPAANANPDASASVGPYTVQVHQLACDLDAGAACAYLQDEYAFDFAPAAAPSRVVRVYMGQTQNIDLLQTQGPNTWRVRNLRSYQTSLTDDAWNFAYFIAWQPISD